MRTYNFHTRCNGSLIWVVIREDSLSEALRTLRDSLRDGETIVGWQS